MSIKELLRALGPSDEHRHHDYQHDHGNKGH